MRKEERGDERIKYVESLTQGTRGATPFAKLGACGTRVDKARRWQGDAEREKIVDKAVTRGLLRLAA
ncbi:hypothetical protein MTR_8g465970 [Medicago truncatula]|uniref:Uncharacterized protein n=1 Tax=Medicago truncatula TaxID=3880 RepID=A0A072TQH1_MEDTR|nr:hypothetical protein MTR_8g465970 [Medicago truncatula]